MKKSRFSEAQIVSILKEVRRRYEEIYLKAYDSVRAARCGIAQYLQFYNSQRPHQAHGQATPDEAYFAALPFALMQAA